MKYSDLKKIIEKIYKSYDSKQPPINLAINYINTIKNLNNIDFQGRLNNNISLASDNESFELLSKKLPLISDIGIISHYTNNFVLTNETRSNPYVQDLPYLEDPLSGINVTTSTYADCPSLNTLGKWLIACEAMIKEGMLFYLPRTKTKSSHKVHIHVNHHSRSSHNDKIEELYNNNYIYENSIDAIIKEKKILELKTKSFVKAKYIRSILSINIPIIEDVDLATFSKINVDEQNYFNLFKLYLREKLIDLEENKSNENQEQNIEKIKLQITREVNSLSKDIKRMKQKRAIQVSGASIVSVVATLVVVDPTIFKMWQSILGTGSGLYLLSQTIQGNKSEYDKLKQNNMYYLWLLDKYNN